MQIVMSVIFILWLVVESSHLHTVILVMTKSPVEPEQKNVSMLVFTEALMLYVCAHYFGWLFGIIAFLAQLLYVLGYCFSWMLMIPIMKCDPYATHKFFMANTKALPVSLVTSIAVMLASYWFVDKKYLYHVVSDHLWILAVVAGVAVLSIILRYLVQKHIMTKAFFNGQ